MKKVVWSFAIIGGVFAVALIATYPLYGSIGVGLGVTVVTLLFILDYRRGIRSWNSSARYKAVKLISDQDRLLDIALHDRDNLVRLNAANHISDQKLLVKYLLATPSTRDERTLKRISDQELLRSIAAASQLTWRMRIAAAERLPLENVARIKCLTSPSLEIGQCLMYSISGVDLNKGANSYGSANHLHDSHFITLLPGEWMIGVVYFRELKDKTWDATTTYTSRAQLELVVQAEAGADYGVIGTLKDKTFEAKISKIKR
jgi:hypothetical protein